MILLGPGEGVAVLGFGFSDMFAIGDVGGPGGTGGNCFFMGLARRVGEGGGGHAVVGD